MLTTREKVIGRKVKHPVNAKFIKKINNRLNSFKEESGWSLDYAWDKAKKSLAVKTNMLNWDIVFDNNTVNVFVEYSWLLTPFISPYKTQVISELNKEIDMLNQ